MGLRKQALLHCAKGSSAAKTATQAVNGVPSTAPSPFCCSEGMN
jgi:hypothetical protein